MRVPATDTPRQYSYFLKNTKGHTLIVVLSLMSTFNFIFYRNPR